MPIILQWPSKPWRMVYVFHCHTSFVELWGEFTPGIGICSWSPWISGRAPRSLPGPWPPRYHPRCRRPAHNHCLSWKWSKITEITQYGCMFSYMKPCHAMHCHAINLWPIFFFVQVLPGFGKVVAVLKTLWANLYSQMTFAELSWYLRDHTFSFCGR